MVQFSLHIVNWIGLQSSHAYPVKISTIFILKYYSNKSTHKIFVHKNLVFYNCTYYVGFISICNDITGEDAVRPLVLFTDCAIFIASGGALSYLGGD